MSRKREPNPDYETQREESVSGAPDGSFDDDLTLFEDLTPFDGGEQVPESNASFPDRDDFLFYDRLTFDGAPENDFNPPEPQEPPEIDLTAYEKPDPTDYTAPDPTDYCEPDPADYCEPDPTDYTAPDPTDYSEPDPTDYTAPDPTFFTEADPTDPPNADDADWDDRFALVDAEPDGEDLTEPVDSSVYWADDLTLTDEIDGDENDVGAFIRFIRANFSPAAQSSAASPSLSRKHAAPAETRPKRKRSAAKGTRAESVEPDAAKGPENAPTSAAETVETNVEHVSRNSKRKRNAAKATRAENAESDAAKATENDATAAAESVEAIAEHISSAPKRKRNVAKGKRAENDEPDAAKAPENASTISAESVEAIAEAETQGDPTRGAAAVGESNERGRAEEQIEFAIGEQETVDGEPAEAGADDFETRLEELRNAARAGDATANYALGRLYEEGARLPRNERMAFEYYRIAARNGSPEAGRALALCYRWGVGTKIDERQAARWFRRAARAGDAVALYEFGLCRADGRGVEPDLARAALAFRRAARLGLESAAVAYGLALLYGRGVPSDVSRGKRVLERAARRGSGRAKGALRQFERAGKPVPKSSGQAQEASAGKSNALATEFSLADLPRRRGSRFALPRGTAVTAPGGR